MLIRSRSFNIDMTAKPDFSSLYPYVYKQLAALPPDELLKLVNDERIKNGDEPFAACSIHQIKRKFEDMPSVEHFKESNRKPLDSWKL